MRQIWKHLAAGIMGLLGFASWGKSLVNDCDEDGKPIKGIRVSVRLKHSPWSKDEEDKLYSDDKGAYQLTRADVVLKKK